MTAQFFNDSGSRGSSWGSSILNNCYPKKHRRDIGFLKLGSRGSSTSNFSAEKKLVCTQMQKMHLHTNYYYRGYEIENSATSATYIEKSLMNKELFGVAVPENSATRTATYCYQITTIIGGISIMEKNPTIKQLRKQLGYKYRIMNMDLALCLYRDFGNGFDVEIYGVSDNMRNSPVTLYLWYGDKEKGFINIKRVKNIEHNAEAIHTAVEELYKLSESILAQGYDWISMHDLINKI